MRFRRIVGSVTDWLFGSFFSGLLISLPIILVYLLLRQWLGGSRLATLGLGVAIIILVGWGETILKRRFPNFIPAIKARVAVFSARALPGFEKMVEVRVAFVDYLNPIGERVRITALGWRVNVYEHNGEEWNTIFIPQPPMPAVGWQFDCSSAAVEPTGRPATRLAVETMKFRSIFEGNGSPRTKPTTQPQGAP